MKLLRAVIRFCGVHTANGRVGMAVPHDFRATVPAPRAMAHTADTGMAAACPTTDIVATTPYRPPATSLAASLH